MYLSLSYIQYGSVQFEVVEEAKKHLILRSAGSHQCQLINCGFYKIGYIINQHIFFLYVATSSFFLPFSQLNKFFFDIINLLIHAFQATTYQSSHIDNNN